MFNNSINTAVLAATLLFKSTDAINCPNARLIKAQGGPDNTCGGGTNHYWPVDYGLDACHAWQGTGTDGRLHTNSAKNMKCEDGVFKFTRYAGNLDSSGSGVDKEIGTTCEQDIVVLIRMEAKEGASIFLDGVECDSGDENDASSTSDSVASPLNDGSSGSISQQSRAVGMLMLSSSLFCVV